LRSRGLGLRSRPRLLQRLRGRNLVRSRLALRALAVRAQVLKTRGIVALVLDLESGAGGVTTAAMALKTGAMIGSGSERRRVLCA
jgi:hypothetical protein